MITRLNNFLCRTNKSFVLLNNIKSRLNDLLCRSNKLFILFQQDNNSFKRINMSFARYSSCSNNIITRSNDLLCRSNKLFILFKRVIYVV